MASSPAGNAALTAQPSSIVLTFNTAVDPARSTISVRFKATQSATGKALPPPQTLHTSAFTASPDKSKLTATLTNPGDPGEFTVTWQAATAGGAVVSGTFTFSQR
jgi:methionine-rich copper-binding protein CopC